MITDREYKGVECLINLSLTAHYSEPHATVARCSLTSKGLQFGKPTLDVWMTMIVSIFYQNGGSIEMYWIRDHMTYFYKYAPKAQFWGISKKWKIIFSKLMNKIEKCSYIESFIKSVRSLFVVQVVYNT